MSSSPMPAIQDQPPGHLLPARPFPYAFVATLGVGVAMLVLGAVSTLATVLVYVGIALFLTLAIDPIMQRAIARRIPRWVAALTLIVVSVIGLVALITAVIPAVTAQVTSLMTQLMEFGRDIPEQAWFIWLTDTFGASIDFDAIVNNATAFLSDPNQLLGLAGGLLAIGSGIIDGLTAVIVVTILTIYFVITLPAIKAKGYRLLPRSRRERVTSLSEEIFQSVGRYVGGQLLLALINGIFTFILTLLAGSPAPALLALIAFVCALIPVIGPVIGTTIAVLLTFIVNPVGAIVVGIALLVYMQIEAYVLTPRVMAKAVAVPGALVIVSAVAGAALAGILGALVAVPVAAAGLIIVDKVVIPRQERV